MRRLLASSAWLFGAEGASLMLKLVSGFVLARHLGVTRFGLLSLVVAFGTLIAQLLEFRSWETTIRFVIKYRSSGEVDKARAVVKLCYLLDLGTAVLSSAATFALAAVGASLFVDEPGTAPLIRVFAGSILLAFPIATSSALLRVADQFRPLAIKTAIIAFVRGGALIGVAVVGAGLREIVWIYVGVAALDALASCVLASFAIGKLGLRGIAATPLSILRGERAVIGRFLALTNTSALLKVLQAQLDVLLVGYFLPTTSAGYVQLARSITDAMRYLAVPINSVSYPEFARLWEHRLGAEATRLTRSLLAITGAIAAAGLVLVVAIADPVVRHVAGPDYAPAVAIVYLLAIGTAIEIPAAIFHPMLIAAGHAARSLVSLAIAVVFRIATLFVLLPEEGARGAGFAHIVCVVVFVVFAGFAVRRSLHELREAGVG